MRARRVVLARESEEATSQPEGNQMRESDSFFLRDAVKLKSVNKYD